MKSISNASRQIGVSKVADASHEVRRQAKAEFVKARPSGHQRRLVVR
jgi:hypothetical protein